ncbi:RNA 3'-terminal phosphate cyclase [Microbulbifer sp. CnH-101-G]|uniref:RNA 3'-terminal phosphate cyclase n=1 Tax=Microbulbifer sp. CnH-101-G TaxID=3243393 RepID=UPI00403A2E12
MIHRYLKSGVPVDEHLADQLILPMALGSGGCFSALKPSLHLPTNIQVIQKLTGTNVRLENLGEDHLKVLVITN